jgi:hypothetical protein
MPATLNSTLNASELPIFPEPYYRQLRCQAPYANLPFMTKGSMSVLLEHPRGVLRLSRDGGTQYFLSEAQRRGLPGVAKVLDDEGAVAPTQQDMGSGLADYIWSAVIERLEPITEEDSAFWSLQMLEQHLSAELDGSLIDCQQTPHLMKMAALLEREVPLLSASINACIQLMDLIQQYHMDLDLSPTNFMRRPATGEIVLSDPIGSSMVLPSASQIAHMHATFAFTTRN